MHDGEVSSEAAVVVAMEEAGAGPGWPVYACPACVHFYGLTPLAEQTEEPASLPAALAARFIGRRDGLPIAPGRPA